MSQEEQGVLINPNPRFTYLAQNQSLVTSNCPETVSYNESISVGSTTTLNFKLDLEGAFLNRAVELDFGEIPLKFTRKTALGAGDKTLAGFFGNWDKICLRQFAMLNAIQTIKTTIDGQLHHSCDDVAESLRAIAPYYKREDVHQYFPAGMPDLYPSYDAYGDASNTINVVGLDHTKTITMKKPAVATDNIFNAISSMNSSRIPIMESITPAYTAATTVADVKLLGQRCPLPFNVFGIATDDIPLYLAKTVMVSVILKGNWWREIFSLVTTNNTADMSSIDFLQANISDFQPKLNYITTVGPAYQDVIRSQIKSCQLGVPTITKLAGQRQEVVKGSAQAKVHSLKFALDTIPMRAYVYAKALHYDADKADSLKEARVPDLYGRIDSLSVQTAGARTNIAAADPGRIYDLCKAAGLNKSFEEYSYFSGAAVCLDYSEALSTKSNTLISSYVGGGSPTIAVDLQFTNLSDKDIVYEIGCIAVYDTILSHKDSKWTLLSTITPETFSTDQHVGDALYNATIQRGNMLGSGFLDTLWGAVKKVGPGLWNLGKALVTNKNGFREDLVKRWEGNGVGQFDSHVPPMGGAPQHPNAYNVTGGQSMENWRVR